MDRYVGQSLSEFPTILILGSTKLGHYVALLPLIQNVRKKWHLADIHYVCGPGLGFERDNHDIDFVHDLRDNNLPVGVDLLINTDQFADRNVELCWKLKPRYIAGYYRDALTTDLEWNDPDFIKRHPECKTGSISEIFCRQAYLDGDFIPRVDADPVNYIHFPDIWISMSANRSAKEWDREHWKVVVDWCAAEGLKVGLRGERGYKGQANEDWLVQNSEIEDYRGNVSLTEFAGSCKECKAVVAIDAGPMHLATATGCPTVGIFGNHETSLSGASPYRLWAPRASNFHPALSPHECLKCEQSRFKNPDCQVPGHPCMAKLTPDRVISILSNILKK